MSAQKLSDTNSANISFKKERKSFFLFHKEGIWIWSKYVYIACQNKGKIYLSPAFPKPYEVNISTFYKKYKGNLNDTSKQSHDNYECTDTNINGMYT